MVAALQAGDYPTATERLDALLRQAPNYPQGAALLGRLGATPAGRTALAQRLAARSAWFHVYLTTFTDATPQHLSDRAAVLQDPAMARAKVTCAEIGPLTSALYSQNRAVEARRLWDSRCGSRAGLLIDGGFEAARLGETSPFAWQFVGAGGLDLRLEPGANGQVLSVASSLPQRRLFATQAVQLPAGRYRLAWLARSAAGSPSPRISARLTCQRDFGPWIDAAARPDGTYAAAVVVPPGCPLQWLELAIDPGSGPVMLDNVAIVPAG